MRSDPTALETAWADALASWAIPPAILEAAPESPYGFPSELFARRGDRAASGAGRSVPTPTTSRALEALAEPGAVLDVGVGGGATSLPLAARCTGLIAVDGQIDMLEAVAARAAALGLPVTSVLGRWPDVASDTPRADVAVCGHVVYNVPELGAFLTALSAHARRRVVIELTERHPLSWMNDLWVRFHELERPEQPCADDVEALCEVLGFDAHRDERVDSADTAGNGFERRGDAIALVRRRLCLTRERDDEIADALGSRLHEHDGLWGAGPHEQRVITLWWEPAGGDGPRGRRR